MSALVPLMIFVVEALAIFAVGTVLLWSVAVTGNDKLSAVWVALGIGVVISLAAFFGSRGGTIEEPAHSDAHGGHH